MKIDLVCVKNPASKEEIDKDLVLAKTLEDETIRLRKEIYELTKISDALEAQRKDVGERICQQFIRVDAGTEEFYMRATWANVEAIMAYLNPEIKMAMLDEDENGEIDPSSFWKLVLDADAIDDVIRRGFNNAKRQKIESQYNIESK